MSGESPPRAGDASRPNLRYRRSARLDVPVSIVFASEFMRRSAITDLRRSLAGAWRGPWRAEILRCVGWAVLDGGRVGESAIDGGGRETRVSGDGERGRVVESGRTLLEMGGLFVMGL